MILEAACGIKHKNGKNTVFLHSLKEDAVLKCIVASGSCLYTRKNGTTVLPGTLCCLDLLVLSPLEAFSNS